MHTHTHTNIHAHTQAQIIHGNKFAKAVQKREEMEKRRKEAARPRALENRLWKLVTLSVYGYHGYHGCITSVEDTKLSTNKQHSLSPGGENLLRRLRTRRRKSAKSSHRWAGRWRPSLLSSASDTGRQFNRRTVRS
jgi:hypothetical protein